MHLIIKVTSSLSVYNMTLYIIYDSDVDYRVPTVRYRYVKSVLKVAQAPIFPPLSR